MGLADALVAVGFAGIGILPEQRLQAWPIEQTLGPRDILAQAPACERVAG
jgi:hypothetical protein